MKFTNTPGGRSWAYTGKKTGARESAKNPGAAALAAPSTKNKNAPPSHTARRGFVFFQPPVQHRPDLFPRHCIFGARAVRYAALHSPFVGLFRPGGYFILGRFQMRLHSRHKRFPAA